MEKTTAALTAREIYQVLKDIALETRTLANVSDSQSGQIEIEADGWRIMLITDDNKLSQCQACQSPEGRRGTAEMWQRYGTDPVKLLSIWEHEQLLRLLKLSAPQV